MKEIRVDLANVFALVLWLVGSFCAAYFLGGIGLPLFWRTVLSVAAGALFVVAVIVVLNIIGYFLGA